MFDLSRRLVALGLLVLLLGVGGAVYAQTTAEDTGTPAASEPTTSATLEAGEVTAGQIADRIAAAWANVTSYRSTTRILPATVGSDATPSVDLAGTAERQVILPDQKRIVISDAFGSTEIVLSGGVLSKRTTPPGGEPGEWETIDPARVAPDDPFGRTYETILAEETPPYSGLSGRQRDRIGTDQGEVEINGKTCTGFLFPEVAPTGERTQVIIYLDASDLPCRIETRAGLTISQTDYVFNQEKGIATPVSAETPQSDSYDY